MSKNYLFVCRRNIHRSPAAVKWLSRYSKAHELDIDARSAGIISGGKSSEILTPDFGRWADYVFVMEGYMAEDAKKACYPVDLEGKIHNLEIPDLYKKNFHNKIPENMTPQEAEEYFKKEYKRRDFVIGTPLFNLLLESRMAGFINTHENV